MSLLSVVPLFIVWMSTLMSPLVGDVMTEKATPQLLLVGGGGTTDAIRAHALARVGGPKKTRLLVISQASTRPEAGQGIAAMWRKDGVQDIELLDIAHPLRAKAQVKAANFIWMGGGSQTRLMDALKKADLVPALKASAKKGVLIGGTSAGTAVMTSVMIARGDSRSLSQKSYVLGQGLGLLDKAVVDQHFLARSRFNRLCSVVLEKPSLVGIGIDERTAIAVGGDEFEVVGESAVVVLDNSQGFAAGQGGADGTWSGLGLSVLRSGHKFSLAKRQMVKK